MLAVTTATARKEIRPEDANLISRVHLSMIGRYTREVSSVSS